MTTSVNGNHSAKNGAYNKDHDYDQSLINRKLPKELLLRIFSYLDVITLCRCAQVSKVIIKFFHMKIDNLLI